MRSNVSPARLLRWIPRLLLIAAVTLVFIYPFWWMMVNSLNTNAQVFGPPRLLPQSWRWQNYVEIQKQPFARHYANTLLVAGVGTLGNVLISALSGYGFARVRFPGRGILFILLLTALMMPVEVIIIPLFYQMKAWHLTDSLLPLIFLPVFCSQGALSAFMFRQFFITVPKELEEAAEVDGANAFQRFFKITLPGLSSVTFLVVTLGTIWSFQVFDLVYTMTGGGPGTSTVTLVLTTYNAAFKEYNMGYASAVAMLMFVFVLAVSGLQKLLLKGGED